jgi:hypothetical protein
VAHLEGTLEVNILIGFGVLVVVGYLAIAIVRISRRF